MTHFLDGPAQGQRLMLKRTPIFLRVVEKAGKFDALDQPSDQPEPGETLHAYRLAERRGTCHVNMGRGRGGFYNLVDYCLCDPQPASADMRTTVAWHAWVEARATANDPKLSDSGPGARV